MKITKTETYKLLWINVFLLAAILIYFWPVPVHLGSTIYGYEGDSTGSIYELWTRTSGSWRIFGNHLISERGVPYLFEVNDWPYLTSSALVVPGVILAKVIGPIAAYNLLVISGMLATGLTTSLLVRKLTSSWMVALWGGFVYTMLPFHQLSATAWYSQVHLETLPLTVLCILRLRENFTSKRVLQLISVLILASLTNAYVALFCASILLIMMPLTVSSAFNSSRKLKNFYFALIAGAAISAFIINFFRKQVEPSLSRDRGELVTYGLRIRELFQIPKLNPLLSARLPTLESEFFHGSNIIEVSHFLGWITISLSIVGIGWGACRKSTRTITLNFVTLMLTAFWVGASHGLTFFGTSLPVPAQIINSFAPFWRVYSRFGVVVGLAVVLLASLGLSFVLSLIRNRALRLIFLVSLIIGSSIELFTPLSGRYTKLVEPSYVKVLQKESPKSVLLYPIVDEENAHTYKQNFWQIRHRIPLVNGGPVPSRQARMQQAIRNISSPNISDFFNSIGAGLVVIDLSNYEQETNQRPIIRDQNLITIFRDEEYLVIRTKLQKVQSVGWYEGEVFSPELKQNGETWRWLGQNFQIVIRTSEAGCYSTKFSLPGIYPDQNILFKPSTTKRQIKIQSGYDRELFLELSRGTNTIAARASLPSQEISATDGRMVNSYGSDLQIRRVSSKLCQPSIQDKSR
jgi:hypothetical protein